MVVHGSGENKSGVHSITACIGREHHSATLVLIGVIRGGVQVDFKGGLVTKVVD